MRLGPLNKLGRLKESVKHQVKELSAQPTTKKSLTYKLLSALGNLTKKNIKWEWKPVHDSALKQLKESFTTEAFAYFDPNLMNRSHWDASPVGLAACYVQFDPVYPLNTRRLYKCKSRVLTDVERRYLQVQRH